MLADAEPTEKLGGTARSIRASHACARARNHWVVTDDALDDATHAENTTQRKQADRGVQAHVQNPAQ